MITETVLLIGTEPVILTLAQTKAFLEGRLILLPTREKEPPKRCRFTPRHIKSNFNFRARQYRHITFDLSRETIDDFLYEPDLKPTLFLPKKPQPFYRDMEDDYKKHSKKPTERAKR